MHLFNRRMLWKMQRYVTGIKFRKPKLYYNIYHRKSCKEIDLLYILLENNHFSLFCHYIKNCDWFDQIEINYEMILVEVIKTKLLKLIMFFMNTNKEINYYFSMNNLTPVSILNEAVRTNNLDIVYYVRSNHFNNFGIDAFISAIINKNYDMFIYLKYCMRCLSGFTNKFTWNDINISIGNKELCQKIIDNKLRKSDIEDGISLIFLNKNKNIPKNNPIFMDLAIACGYNKIIKMLDEHNFRFSPNILKFPIKQKNHNLMQYLMCRLTQPPYNLRFNT
jgi:hypothetical protein